MDFNYFMSNVLLKRRVYENRKLYKKKVLLLLLFKMNFFIIEVYKEVDFW